VRKYPDGNSIKIHSLDDGGDSVLKAVSESICGVSYNAFKPRSLGFSLDLIGEILRSDSNIIHSHGVWMLTTLAPLCATIKYDKPYIISPHGMLDPWIISRGKLKKFIAMWAYEKWSWANASIFHALNTKEADAIRQVVPNARIVVAPNGIDVSADDFVSHMAAEITRFLFLGRFHPKKNLHSLASAICEIGDEVYRKSPFVLDIVGWGDELYEAEIRRIAAAKPERFNFLGPKFGEEKDAVIKQSHCFILPSFSEGQPVAVLEAMKAGTPVLINANCNMPELSALNLTADCGVSVDEIKQALLWFLALSDSDRQALRRASFDYVYQHYSWSAVLPLYEQMYKELV
jgi:poly(glycerol-phosphate) alpha-glucosyltransferase